MTGRVYSFLESFARYLFFILLILNGLNWIISFNSEIIIRKLPFTIDQEGIASTESEDLIEVLEGRIVIAIDSIRVDINRFKDNSDPENPFEKIEKDNNIFRSGFLGFQIRDEQQIKLENHIKDKLEVEVTLLELDSGIQSSISVNTVKALNKSEFMILLFNIIFMFFIFFNTNLILKYSQARENYIIVYFFLFMAFPDKIPFINITQFSTFIITPFLGVLFYHYSIQKISDKRSSLVIYITTFILSLTFYFVNKFYEVDLSLILILWSIFWFLYSFVLLGRSFKVSQSIEIKRLINAFRGILISLICLVIVGVLFFLVYLISGGTSLQITNLSMIVLVAFIILAGFGFLLGILWFFGSFTWSLLTGTVLDVKIRSTMIYTIVGVFFITIFGLVDYTLGELLQSLFGNFIGSEFIAGIPATIGLLVFFNPIRNRVEAIVDSKLNTSDLDFLERTDTFSDNLSDEGVIEGFEEYICENLIHRLPIKKVALISYDNVLDYFKFNEIRGSEVVENSMVEDIHSILDRNELYKSYIVNENEQDISSFSIIIPIINENDYKWFLALGRKIDGSVYSRKDETSFVKLANKIKLSEIHSCLR